ncbi:MAG: hypothetical protein NTZ78_08040 [Candidatus Aureabacteria bacterium]|nr:hypothetical protein [Candidatus Auribacterota bacterium]
MLTPTEYYRDPEVRERIAEYCGGSAQEPELCTAEYLVGYGEALIGNLAPEPYISTPKNGFNSILENGLDIFRSLWDKVHTLGVLDVEYYNMDYPGEVYLNPSSVFKKIEPVYRAIKEVYARYGIQPMVMMTGQGYHFSFQIQSGTKTDLMLESLGHLIDSLKGKYSVTVDKRHRRVSARHGRSFEGMGRIMEFLAHEIIRAAETPLPVMMTDVAVGRSRGEREAISLDLSSFGDPIYMRDLRCAFSTHQKHKVQRQKVGNGIADGTPVQVSIPCGKLSLEECLKLRRHFRNAADYARSVYCYIPDFTVNLKKVIEHYQKSELYRFHQWFDSEKQDPWTEWDRTYRSFDMRVLPPCVQHSLRVPNDNLLKPTNLQTLTRCLLALGWHPQHIAGLVRSKWEGNYGWGPNRWAHFDAGSRSSFYVRLFAGQLAAKVDKMVDHNCISHLEKGFCWQPNCGYSLGMYQWNGKF